MTEELLTVDIAEKIAKIMDYSYERSELCVNASVRKSEGNVFSIQSFFNPCASAGDAEPVIEKFKVTSDWSDHFNQWVAYCGEVTVKHENRLSACMMAVLLNDEATREDVK